MQNFILMQNTYKRDFIGGGILGKASFLVNIECCPEYLEYALYISLLVSLVFRWFAKVGHDVSVNFYVTILESFFFFLKLFTIQKPIL